MKTLEEKQKLAQDTLERLLGDYKTASLATSDQNGIASVSYAPVAVDREKNFYLFVSELSEHTSNLLTNPSLSLMLIEDESRSDQLFARARLTLKGTAREIARDSEEWDSASRVYGERFGKFFDQLATLKDFHMFCLVPQSARVVVGFGAAFEIQLPGWGKLELLTGK